MTAGNESSEDHEDQATYLASTCQTGYQIWGCKPGKSEHSAIYDL